MKTLILFYSRTGTTRKVAEKLSSILQADIEEVFDTADRAGASGYLLSGRDATLKKLTTLKPLARKVSDYDLVIIGTPIWAWTMSTPILTLLTEQKSNMPQVAFFCTQGGSGSQRAFAGMAEITGKKPVATLELLTKEVVQDQFSEAINNFVDKINQLAK
jgi:flavodoxin